MAGRTGPGNTHGKTRSWVFRGVVCAAVLLVGYLIFELGRIQAHYNVIETAAEQQVFEDSIAGLKKEIGSLKEQIVLLETNSAIDREGYKEVESRLAKLRNKIQEQGETIEFYRGIVAPADGQKGLRVQNLRLSKGSEERAFNVRLVLIQTKQHDRSVKGQVNVSIEGLQSGVAATLEMEQLLPAEAKSSWLYAFRYFQKFDRELQLPEGFVPEKVNIELRSQSTAVDNVSQSFPWQIDQ